MNKWIVLFATILMTIAFSSTIGSTIANPSTSNVIISLLIGVTIIGGLFVFIKSDKKPKQDELKPCD